MAQEFQKEVGFLIATEYLDAHSLRDHMEHGRPLPEQVHPFLKNTRFMVKWLKRPRKIET
jgi:hypothetical protein